MLSGFEMLGCVHLLVEHTDDHHMPPVHPIEDAVLTDVKDLISLGLLRVLKADLRKIEKPLERSSEMAHVAVALSIPQRLRLYRAIALKSARASFVTRSL